MNLMKLLFLTLFALILAACSKPGFDLEDSASEDDEEETTSDPSFHGPSEGNQWQLVLDDDDDDFTLRKFSSSSGALIYTLRGAYTQLDNGFLQLSISDKPSSISATRIAALRLGERAVIFRAFESSSNDIIALINDSDCPSSDLRSSFIELQSSRDPSGEEDPEVAGAIGLLRYSVSSEVVRLSSSWSLNDELSESNEVNIDSGECAEGIVELDDGDHYLSNQSSAVIERDTENYSRLLALPSSDIDALSSLDGDYVGFLSDMNEPSDSLFISAECSDGLCIVYSETDFSAITRASRFYRFDIAEEEIDSPDDGLFSSSLVFDNNIDVGEGNMLCLANSDIDSSSSNTTALIACAAQSPSSDGADARSLLNLLLINRES
jgi:hypothetical protein